MSRASPPALGLYIHFPFCAYKCGYCDFNSWVEKDTEPQRQWLEGIRREIHFWKSLRTESAEPLFFDTVFMGGGTPSLLQEDLWEELSSLLRSEFSFTPDLEWTVECNPETITDKLLKNLREIGVNRLSLGIQSFQEKYLKRLERGASPEANHRALALLQSSWTSQWSLDLMFGLPLQTKEEWLADLNIALQYKPRHLSAYQLTLTTEKSKKWLQGTDGELLDFFRTTRECLAGEGLLPYEISNFAQPGEECRHNLKYWRAESFLGLGPGAYSLLPPELVGAKWGAHWKNPSKFSDWQLSTHSAKLEKLELRDEKTHVTELLMLGLRLEEGIEKHRFPRELSWGRLSPIVDLLEIKDDFIRPSPVGRELLDTTILKAVSLLFPE